MATIATTKVGNLTIKSLRRVDARLQDNWFRCVDSLMYGIYKNQMLSLLAYSAHGDREVLLRQTCRIRYFPKICNFKTSRKTIVCKTKQTSPDPSDFCWISNLRFINLCGANSLLRPCAQNLFSIEFRTHNPQSIVACAVQ